MRSAVAEKRGFVRKIIGLVSIIELHKKGSIDTFGVPIMVNGATRNMGRAVLEEADAAGLYLVPEALSDPEDLWTILVCKKGPSEKKSILSYVYAEHPNLIVVEYTAPAAVNGHLVN